MPNVSPDPADDPLADRLFRGQRAPDHPDLDSVADLAAIMRASRAVRPPPMDERLIAQVDLGPPRRNVSRPRFADAPRATTPARRRRGLARPVAGAAACLTVVTLLAAAGGRLSPAVRAVVSGVSEAVGIDRPTREHDVTMSPGAPRRAPPSRSPSTQTTEPTPPAGAEAPAPDRERVSGEVPADTTPGASGPGSADAGDEPGTGTARVPERQGPTSSAPGTTTNAGSRGSADGRGIQSSRDSSQHAPDRECATTTTTRHPRTTTSVDRNERDPRGGGYSASAFSRAEDSRDEADRRDGDRYEAAESAGEPGSWYDAAQRWGDGAEGLRPAEDDTLDDTGDRPGSTMARPHDDECAGARR